MFDIEAARVELAWACRILYLAEQMDMTLGHISCRIPGTDRILLKPKSRGFDEVLPDEIQILDLDGNKIAGPHPVHFEWPIHTELYRARPDVNCVLHAHPALATAMSAVNGPLPIVCHDAVMFVDSLRYYEGSPELVIRSGHGQELVDALGPASTLLMRNHGTVIVERSIKWAVITAVVLERAIAMYLRAREIGAYSTISADLARAMYPSKYNDKLIDEYWAHWVRRCVRAGCQQGLPSPEAQYA